MPSCAGADELWTARTTVLTTAYILGMQELVQQRIRKLRQEIAEIGEANKLHLQSAKTPLAVAEQQRRLQRLQEILDELMALTDWKKT